MSGLNGQVIILSAVPYAFRDKDSGREIAGTSVQFTDGQPMAGDAQGWAINKCSMPVEAGRALRVVPGVYKAEFGLKPNPQTRKPEGVILSIEFVAGLFGGGAESAGEVKK